MLIIVNLSKLTKEKIAIVRYIFFTSKKKKGGESKAHQILHIKSDIPFFFFSYTHSMRDPPARSEQEVKDFIMKSTNCSILYVSVVSMYVSAA